MTSGALLRPMSTAARCRSPGRDYNGPVSLSYKVIDASTAMAAASQRRADAKLQPGGGERFAEGGCAVEHGDIDVRRG